MFGSNVSRDDASRRVKRRAMIAGGAAVVGVAALSLRRSPTVEASGLTHGTPGDVTIVAFSDDGKKLGKQTVAKVVKTDAAWREQLGANSYGIARQADADAVLGRELEGAWPRPVPLRLLRHGAV